MAKGVTITVKGDRELVAAMKRAGALTDSETRKAVKETLVDGEAHIKRLLSQPGTGRLYGTHRASAPGNPPAVDTGTYRGSWRNRILASGAGLHGGEIYTTQERGPWLENGTARMAARPHAGPTAEHVRETLPKFVGAAIKRMEGAL